MGVILAGMLWCGALVLLWPRRSTVHLARANRQTAFLYMAAGVVIWLITT